MTEFHEHSGPVHDVEFHPHEFLLASASQDKTVKFWDLEQFKLVSTSDRDSGPVRFVKKELKSYTAGIETVGWMTRHIAAAGPPSFRISSAIAWP